MSSASESTIQALEFVVKTLPVGTNLALLHVLWALLSGAFLSSRGAVFPALLRLGLCAAQVRRSSQAVRDGASTSAELIRRSRTWQAAHSAWRPDQFDGYQPVAVDITAFWRPQLQGWWGKFFNHLANRASKPSALPWWSKSGTTVPNVCPCSNTCSAPRPIRSARAIQSPGAATG